MEPAYASETLVRHGAIIEKIEIENDFSKVIINQNQDEEKTGYILTEFLEEIDSRLGKVGKKAKKKPNHKE